MLWIEDLQIRPLSENDGEGFVSLINAEYSRKKSVEYYLWQDFNTPLKTVIVGAFLDDRLLGSMGLQCRKLSNGLTGGQIIDIIVAKEHRKKGVFTKIAGYAFDYFSNEIDFGFILSNEAGRIAVERALEWKEVGLIKTLFLNKRQENSTLNSWVDSVDDLCSIGMDNNKNLPDRLFFIRDTECMRWRFGSNPEYNYFIQKKENVFTVGKIFTDPVSGEKYGDIVDYGCEGRMDLLKEVFDAAIIYFNRKGIDRITTWAFPDTAVYTYLRDAGFAESEQKRYFCLKAFKPKLRYLYNFRNWLLVEADSEIY